MSEAVFKIVTDRVVDILAKGVVPWRKPWKATANKMNAPHNIMGYAYNGINFFLLSCLGYATPVYLTLNQINKLGGRIKEGEEKNSFPVFFWRWLDVKDKATGEDKKIPLCRYTRVWNIEQVDGVKMPKKFIVEDGEKYTFNSIAAADAVVEGYENKPTIRHNDTGAFYMPHLDMVRMPNKDQFTSPESYYTTLFHELGHSTGHASRLNRKEVTDPIRFGSHDYSVEELVAEMTAAYLCAHCGIDNTLENSAAYIEGWMRPLKKDPRMLMTAAARAQKAFYHIVGRPETDEEEKD